ncbi:hypothetical protein HYH03_016022 [Edaphochlamys debaryana]|uniref:Peptidase M43 pregnancy-associated plasma-A domain-containing protein n=1 Tax=Edaphochlamys debaryana TaxID=47281 RepID=A0A835XJZ3_9CHLO|nr:hypothetical protein HYH03_016022 [Edaphochlamys debaryana]|eukprot:KAG2485236.1 hypothetical protein HYH03_016022 [Edaphochlamys debaryana]
MRQHSSRAAVLVACLGALISLSAASDDTAALRLHSSQGARLHRRALRGTWPSNFIYDMPPDFQPAPPASLPALYVPLVVHVLTYRDPALPGGVGPPRWAEAPAFVDRMLRITNVMSRPTNFTFFIKELRYNGSVYPDLLLPNKTAWEQAYSCKEGIVCLPTGETMNRLVTDFPRSIQVFIVDTNTNTYFGDAHEPGSDILPMYSRVWLSWSLVLLPVDAGGSNSALAYNSASSTLLHELFHHLGLGHTFGNVFDDPATNSCADDDGVADTSATWGSAISSSFATTAYYYCKDLFWIKYGGDWNATYQRLSTRLGTPVEDMNAWADSCPGLPGYDSLGNHMTYDNSVCTSTLGHFTRGQVEQAHQFAAVTNPVRYAWGQYYATHRDGLPSLLDPEPEPSVDPCKTTLSGCACKAKWRFDGVKYGYCSRVSNQEVDPRDTFCEAADPAKCIDCGDVSPCILTCIGTSALCDPPRRRVKPPPPWPPIAPSPPPAPAPPPPKAIPPECMVANNGCPCRPLWIGGYKEFYRYCANPNNDNGRLWCQLDTSCPGWKALTGFSAFCDARLNVTYCGTELPKGPPAAPQTPSVVAPHNMMLVR